MIDKSDPFVKRVRADMAEIYRKVRADSPAIARLLFKRERQCFKELVYSTFETGPNPLLHDRSSP